MAAENIVRRVRHVDDRTIVEAIEQICALFPDATFTARLLLSGSLAFTLEEIEDRAALTGRYSFERATLTIALEQKKSLNFALTRQPQKDNVPAAGWDEWRITIGNEVSMWKEPGDKALVAACIDIITRLDLAHASPSETDDASAFREITRDFGASHRQMLAELDQAIKQNKTRLDELDQEFARKEVERQEAHQKALDELEAEREQLELQSYKTARRSLITSISSESALSQLRKTLAPTGAIRARWAVFGAAAVVSVFAGVIAYQSITRLGIEEEAITTLLAGLPEGADADAVTAAVTAALGPVNWYLIGRTALSIFIAVGAMLFAANWLKGFYAGDIAAAREIDRNNQDLIRANWVAETLLEFKEEHEGATLPEEWVKGATRGLFDHTRGASEMDDGTRALKALMGFAASTSVGPNGVQVDIGKNGTKAMNKAGNGAANAN